MAEVTTQARGLAVEVPIDTGIDHASVVNCHGLHTVSQRRLTHRLGSVAVDTLEEVCDTLSIALGCDRH